MTQNEVTAIGIAISALGFYSRPIVDTVPTGFPPFTLARIPWDRLPALLLSGVLIALIGFTEAASISRRFASEERAAAAELGDASNERESQPS